MQQEYFNPHNPNYEGWLIGVTMDHGKRTGSNPVEQYDADGRLLNTFRNMTQAEKNLGLSRGSICEAIRDGRQAGGYTFKLVTDSEEAS